MKISIVTPSYNQVEYLKMAMHSVIDQKYHELEYVVIDGGSTDGSREVISGMADHLHYWISEPDRGHAHALNKGFRKCTGEILAWINSDDMYCPWAFSVISDIFNQRPDVRWVTGMHGMWDKQGVMTNVNAVFKNRYDYLRGRYAWIQQESVFFRRDLWEEAGAYIDESYKYMVDGELWSRYFGLTDLWHIQTVLSGFRLHDGNRSALNSKAVREEMSQIVCRMRQDADERTRKDLRLWNNIEKICRIARVIRIPLNINSIIRNTARGFDSRVEYKMLSHQNGEWMKNERSRFL